MMLTRCSGPWPSSACQKVVVAAEGPQREPGKKGGGSGDMFANFVDAIRASDRAKLEGDIVEGHSAGSAHFPDPGNHDFSNEPLWFFTVLQICRCGKAHSKRAERIVR